MPNINTNNNNIMRGMMNQHPRSPAHQQQQQQYHRNPSMQNIQIHQQQQQAMRQFNPELFNNIYNHQYPPRNPNLHPQQLQHNQLTLGMQPFELIQHQLPPPGHHHQQPNMLVYPQHQQQNMLVHSILPQQQQQQHYPGNPMQHLQWYPQMLQVMNQQHMQTGLLQPPMNIRHPQFVPPNELINNNQANLVISATSTPNSQIFSSGLVGSSNGLNLQTHLHNKTLDNQHNQNNSDLSKNNAAQSVPSGNKEAPKVIQETLQRINEEGLKPSVPYYELPAGLMVPLIGLADREYKPINPNELRLPPPTVPSEKLLKAVEDYYKPSCSAPLKIEGQAQRDNDGWNRQFIDDYIKKKGQAMVEAMLAN